MSVQVAKRRRLAAAEHSRLALHVALMWAAAAISMPALIIYSYLRQPGTDFDAIWLGLSHFVHHQTVYSLTGPTNLLYLFPPSSLLLLWPLGLVPLKAVSLAYLVAEATSIIAAAYISIRLFGIPLKSVMAPIVFLLVTFAPPTLDELRWRNVDGIVVLVVVGALFAMSRSKWAAGGLLLGLAFSLKPTALPLLLLPLLYRQWKSTAIALVIPAVLTVAGALLSRDGADFLSGTVPFLLSGEGPNVRDNIAIAGVLGTSPLGTLARLIVVALGITSIWKVRTSQELSETSQLVAMTGLLLVTMYLAFSYAFLRYLLYLLPAVVMLAIYRDRIVRGLYVVGLVLLVVPYSRVYAEHLASLGGFVTALDSFRFTLASALFLGALTVVAWRSRPSALPGAEARPVV